MKPTKNYFGIALLIMVVWTIIVLGGEILQAGPGSLDALVTQQIVASLIVAPLFLLGVIVYFKWNRAELGLQAPQPARSWLLGWLPALFILAFIGVGVVGGLPPVQTIIFVLINTLLVGVSEELMFRGIVFWGALPKFSIWAAILISSLLFGGIHTLNGLMTGDYTAALAQALQATMFGVWIMAIRLKSKSLIPVMVIHGLWDFGLFLMAASAMAKAAPASAVEAPLVQQLLAPSLLELPLFLYGLWLLRGIGRKAKTEVLP